MVFEGSGSIYHISRLYQMAPPSSQISVFRNVPIGNVINFVQDEKAPMIFLVMSEEKKIFSCVWVTVVYLLKLKGCNAMGVRTSLKVEEYCSECKLCVKWMVWWVGSCL